jgi:hypothetical protein
MFPQRRIEGGYWTFVWKFEDRDGFYSTRYPSPDRANYYAWDDRWYWLFGQLAGVRGYGPPIAEPRGVPKDAGIEVQEYMADEDFHTPSWLTLAELQAHPWEERAKAEGDYVPGDLKQLHDWLARLAEIDPNPHNVRVVFAFDN